MGLEPQFEKHGFLRYWGEPACGGGQRLTAALDCVLSSGTPDAAAPCKI